MTSLCIAHPADKPTKTECLLLMLLPENVVPSSIPPDQRKVWKTVEPLRTTLLQGKVTVYSKKTNPEPEDFKIGRVLVSPLARHLNELRKAVEKEGFHILTGVSDEDDARTFYVPQLPDWMSKHLVMDHVTFTTEKVEPPPSKTQSVAKTFIESFFSEDEEEDVDTTAGEELSPSEIAEKVNLIEQSKKPIDAVTIQEYKESQNEGLHGYDECGHYPSDDSPFLRKLTKSLSAVAPMWKIVKEMASTGNYFRITIDDNGEERIPLPFERVRISNITTPLETLSSDDFQCYVLGLLEECNLDCGTMTLAQSLVFVVQSQS